MRQNPGTRRTASEKIVKDIKRATHKQYSAEEKIRIVLDGLRGENSIAELCRREGISQGIWLTIINAMSPTTFDDGVTFTISPNIRLTSA